LKEGRIRRDLAEIRFYTQKEKWLDEEIRKNNLDDIVDVHGFLPRDEVINKLRSPRSFCLFDGTMPRKTEAVRQKFMNTLP
jgi:hypothetical protein